MKSIRAKLTAGVLIICFIGFAAAGGFSFFMARSQIASESIEKTHNLVAYEAAKINGWIDSLKARLNSASTVLLPLEGDDAIRNVLASLKEQDKYLLGFEDDSSINGLGWDPPDTFKPTQRDWYSLGMSAQGAGAITAPYVDAQTGDVVVSFSQYVGKLKGMDAVLCSDHYLTTILDIVTEAKLPQGGYAFLTDADDAIISHSNEDYLPTETTSTSMKDLANYAPAMAAFEKGEVTVLVKDYDGVSRYIMSSPVGDTGWTFYAAVPQSAIYAAFDSTAIWTTIIYAVITASIALCMRIMISRTVTRPVLTLVNASNNLALGNLDVNVASKKDDELGHLSGAFQSMVESTKEQAAALEVLADGDLTVDLKPRCESDTINLAIAKMIASLNGMFQGIQESTMQVAAGSKQIADGAQSLARGSTEQASAIEQLSVSVAEISEKAKQNASVARQAANLSGSIRGNAEKGSKQMSQMMQAVKEINDASGKISNVIKVIDDIAFQTNILALNAAVEAARAGVAGKGFAVVADEVRNLAAKSAEAARDTGELIENSIAKANLGLNIAVGTSDSLSEIVEGINRSSEIAEQIAQSSDEQVGAINQVNNGIDQVAQVVQQNSATAEESAAAAEEMSGQAEILEQLILRFKLKDSAAEFSRSDSFNDQPLELPPESHLNDNGHGADYGKY